MLLKTKPDFSFCIFLIIVIVGGIYLNRLASQKSKLVQENNTLMEVIREQEIGIAELQNLYFQSILPRSDKNEVAGKLCLSWSFSQTDSLENKRLTYLIGKLGGLRSTDICLYVDAEPSEELKTTIKGLNWDLKISSQPVKKALFYVDKNGKIEGYFALTAYSLSLLEKYLKLLRENYLPY